MVAVLVNVGTVLLGSSIGLILKKGIKEKYTTAVMTAIGLCTVLIGISGMLKGENTLVAIVSMVLGTLIGSAFDIDKRLNSIGDILQKKFKKKNSDSVSIAEGFVTASLLFCIGAMTFVGSLEAGINGNNTTLLTKSVLDFFSSMMLSASLGIGVIFASVFVLVFQGSLVLMFSFLGGFLSTGAINEITCVGSLMILALGLNLLGITKIKVANFFPALLFAPIMLFLFSFIPV